MGRVTSSDASAGSFLCARAFRNLAEVTSLDVTNSGRGVGCPEGAPLAPLMSGLTVPKARVLTPVGCVK